MKVKYIGQTTTPLALAIGTIPAVTNGKIYEVILNNEESDCYVIIDDDGLNKVVRKDLFEKLGE
jgi:hypothetical protein